ncbi:MAG: hypothetical protein D6785_08515, partial [Planctomycetota bacterium]
FLHPKKYQDPLLYHPRMEGEWVGFGIINSKVQLEFVDGKRDDLFGFVGMVYYQFTNGGRAGRMQVLPYGLYLGGPQIGLLYAKNNTLQESRFREWGILPIGIKSKKLLLSALYCKTEDGYEWQGLMLFLKNSDRNKDMWYFQLYNNFTKKYEETTHKIMFFRKKYFFQSEWPNTAKMLSKRFPRDVRHLLEIRKNLARVRLNSSINRMINNSMFFNSMMYMQMQNHYTAMNIINNFN